MIFEILFCEYQDGFNSLSELLRSNDIKPMDFDLNVARLNRSYVYALQYFEFNRGGVYPELTPSKFQNLPFLITSSPWISNRSF